MLVIICICLSGCKKDKDEEEEGVGRYGMLDDGTPQFTAVKFMQSLYNDPNTNKVLELSTERLARVLKRYRSNRNIQRNVVNLMFDTVEINPKGAGTAGRSEFSQKATIHLFFTGYKDGDKMDDIRTIEMVKVNGEWRVDKIHPDRFL
ncbi:hypothetical protein J3L16_04055 [Alteromonas sp. 5E99-2]|uniref:hypothetical protein n=1 Tax=Alteromonas sp. 5E99-2 TaxID=2817683 RepID=UPI001A98CE9C|nr:hypothetical protein [Alteromonas sp. 5E99-2]MBO1254862.1 hypothetical protein [Alteromonas sp. 5E99-2]